MLAWIPSLVALVTSLMPQLSELPPTGLASASQAPVTLGIDVLLAERGDLLKGMRVGMLTHAAAVDGALIPSVDRLVRGQKDGGYKVTQLWGPEHGLRGYFQPGEKAGGSDDPKSGVPVENLFGRGKKGRPSKKAIGRVDVIVVDLQDLGSRTYTYISTLGELMVAAKEAGKSVIVVDRPNPAGGLVFEGPILARGLESFIGWGPLPVTHGMTIGEVARFYNDALGTGCDLTVVAMKGWRRAMLWPDTGLEWIPTSPGIPHVQNAWLYPATGMVGGISDNVSEGVGTSLPFELVGAEFIEPEKFAAALAKAQLPGVKLRPVTYRPASFKFKGKVLGGVQLHVTDMRAFRPIRTALAILVALQKLWPGTAEYRDGSADIVWGTPAVLKAVAAGKSVAQIEGTWTKGLEDFAAKREKVLLYP